jgi:hypothetical protein
MTKRRGNLVGKIGNQKYTIFGNKDCRDIGILSRGISGTYAVEFLALMVWNNRHLWVEGWHLTVELPALKPWNTHFQNL